MWLPVAVYESLPYTYVVGGLLLISGAAYIGPNEPLFTTYATLGVIAVFSGIAVSLRRRRARSLLSNSTLNEPVEK